MLQAIVRICQIVFLVLAIAALGWFLYDRWSQDRRIDLDPFRRTLAERAIGTIVEELPRRDAIKRLLVLPVSGDVHGHVTDMLVERLEDARDEYIVVDARDFADKLATPRDVAEGIKLGRLLAKEARPDGVLQSTAVMEYGRKGVGAKVEVDATLVRLDEKANFPGDKVRAAAEIRSRASVDWWDCTMQQTSSLLRFTLWIVLTAGLPFALFPVVQNVTRKENNRQNAILLGGLVGFDVVLAWVLLGLRPGPFGWLLVVLAALSGFIYNFLVCDRIDEMRK